VADYRSTRDGKRSWSGVTGTASEGGILEVDFTSSGYEDPGRVYGPPEDCYPPEGEEEREVVTARLFDEELPEEFRKKIEADLQEIVDEADFDAAHEGAGQYDPG